MKFKIIGQLLVVIVIVISNACDNSSLCLSGQNAIQSGLYSASSDEDKDTTLSGFYMWGIEHPTDSILLDSVKVSKLYMPTDLNRDSTEFVIREEKLVLGEVKGVNDTIQFIFKKNLEYVSGDCGFTYNLEIDTVIHTYNLIDSVVISYSSVVYSENIENVKIYIEP